MKKKMIKNTAVVIAFAMLFSLMAGCGGKKGNQAEGIGSEVVLNGDKIYPIQCEDTLTFWFDGDTLWQQQYNNFGETPLGREIAKKTGVKVEYLHPSGSGATEQFQILLASNELPDIVNSTWSNFSGGPDLAIEQDYIYELGDIIDQYAPALKKVLEEHPKWDSMIKSDKGNYYAFPGFMEEGILQVTMGPLIRSDWVEELKLEKPTTIDEWETVLEAFKNEKGVEIPFIGGINNILQAFAPGFGFWSGWYHDNGAVKYGQAQPEYKNFLTKMNEWYQKGYLDPDFMVYDQQKNTSKILNDKAGATVGYAGSSLGSWLQTNKDKDFDMEGTMYPATEKGMTHEYGYMSNPNLPYSVAISKNCKNVELAARFLDYGFTEEGHNTYNFGIEGESYEWVEKDGKQFPQYTDVITNNPDGITIGNAISLYCRSGHVNVPMVQDVNYITQYYSLPQQQEAQKLWSDTNMANHLLPTLYLQSDEMDKDSEIMSSIATYVEEMMIKFITGQEPLDNFDAYIEQLKKFGIETSTSYRQSAYERALNR